MNELITFEELDLSPELLQALEKQTSAIEQDAKTLQRLQQASQSATGQMESLHYANQLNSALANQMLQMRNLMSMQILQMLEQER